MGLPHSRTVLVAENIFTPNIDLPTVTAYISFSLQVNISATSLNTPPSSTFPSETSTLPFPPLPQKPLNSSSSSAHSPTLQVFSSLPLSEMLRKTLRYFELRRDYKTIFPKDKDAILRYAFLLFSKHKTRALVVLFVTETFPFRYS